MRFDRPALIVSLLLATSGFAAKPDVLLITIDTLRADRLGCYGDRNAQTPVMDRLATEGVRFSNAVSHVPLTRPSHITIFTGLLPFEHRIRDNVAPALDPKTPLLAEVLRNNGYQTAAFVSSFVINSQSGLQRGFDTYEDQFDPSNQPTRFALNLEKRGDQVLKEFTQWHNRKKDMPFFAWVHLYDPHFPYEPPEPYRSRFGDRQYDGEVAYSDEIVGRILKLIKADTLVILTSDHGEGLGEHGESGHSFFIYDTTLHVPLMIRWMGKVPAGVTVSHQVRLIDLFPTILDLLGLSRQGKGSGISLTPWLLDAKKPDPRLYSYCETYTPWLHFGWSRLEGVRAEGWKLIRAPRSELYDLRKDRSESENLYLRNTTVAQRLQEWLTRALPADASQPPPAPELDPETLEKLAALGYAGVASPPPSRGNEADPKDKIEDFRLFNQLIREGIEDFQAERFRPAVDKFQQLRDRGVPSFEVYYYLGRSLLRLKSYDKARTELDLALKKLPHFLPAYKDISEAYEGLGNMKRAEEALLAGLAVSPNHPSLVQPLAWLYQRQKNFPAAEKLLMTELKEYPNDIESRYRLGAIFRDTGRPEQAMAQFRAILSVKPEEAEAHNQVGMLLGGAGKLAEALQSFEEAVRLDPQNKAARHNLELARARLANSTSKTLRFMVIQTSSRAAADTLLRKLKAGESWDALAHDYSIHPSKTQVEASPDEIDPILLQALLQLKAGQISGPIQTPNGFFLLKRL